MKKFIKPMIKVVSLDLADDLMNEKFGNQTYVPVNEIEGDDGEFDGFEDGMYSNQGKYFGDDWDTL